MLYVVDMPDILYMASKGAQHWLTNDDAALTAAGLFH